MLSTEAWLNTCRHRRGARGPGQRHDPLSQAALPEDESWRLAEDPSAPQGRWFGIAASIRRMMLGPCRGGGTPPTRSQAFLQAPGRSAAAWQPSSVLPFLSPPSKHSACLGG